MAVFNTLKPILFLCFYTFNVSMHVYCICMFVLHVILKMNVPDFKTTPFSLCFSLSVPKEPVLRDLQRYVMPHIESDWESLCIELNFDKNGEVLDAIKKECGSNSKASCREVLRHWVKGEGEGPHTWGKMVECLKMIGASGAVNAIKEYLSGVCKSLCLCSNIICWKCCPPHSVHM